MAMTHATHATCLVLMALGFATAAAAQDGPPYTHYVFDAGPEVAFELPAELIEAIGQVDAAIVPQCPAGDRAMTNTVTRLDAYNSYLAGIVPTKTPLALYKVAVVATGCGAEPRAHNAILTAAAETGEVVGLSIGVSGATRSLPFQQRRVHASDGERRPATPS